MEWSTSSPVMVWPVISPSASSTQRRSRVIKSAETLASRASNTVRRWVAAFSRACRCRSFVINVSSSVLPSCIPLFSRSSSCNSSSPRPSFADSRMGVCRNAALTSVANASSSSSVRRSVLLRRMSRFSGDSGREASCSRDEFTPSFCTRDASRRMRLRAASSAFCSARLIPNCSMGSWVWRSPAVSMMRNSTPFITSLFYAVAGGPLYIAYNGTILSQ